MCVCMCVCVFPAWYTILYHICQILESMPVDYRRCADDVNNLYLEATDLPFGEQLTFPCNILMNI